ncbi:hypothetical protein RFI_38638 [Reticulomyxa filosa]|uniref:Uncharacterized protein n=1 Tax=Reticulomyxa filosa TaxID=46433 RepID=X6LDP6_RETFI|nr:hypothetical protein RFI_38638 [Reticulomyxa filosa]|eukprot:ETN98849.1 hypothetical protein RFI_38638 [Reticulomyxa filosa]
MQISAMLNHSIDFNLIYAILYDTQGKIDRAIKFLSMFETWKLQPNNIKKYEKKKFRKKRCCNHQINLFYIFVGEKGFLSRTPIKNATSLTVNNGLPFVKRDYE